ncbi:MAG: hypothetical protein HY507_02500 [Candidatus Zambryskibacteria bacterium]|nr:hypothetical protein [Candidatus Zambryskibacteria bacterium]
MSSKPTLAPSEPKSLERRLDQFFNRLSAEERKSHPTFGPPQGMCEAGKILYEESCEKRSNMTFPSHYMGGKCPQCKEAFLKYLFLVTD